MPMPLKDLSGQRFGRLLAMHRAFAPSKQTRWFCLCECGGKTEASSSNLKSGAVASCGCLRREQKRAQMTALGKSSAKDLMGQKFGRLLVVAHGVELRAGNRWYTKNKRPLWGCQCACGNLAIVGSKELLNGDTRSCGCLRGAKPTHGGSVGGKLSREYRAWRDMRERCYNPRKQNYAFYGAKGVTVCDRWRHTFGLFLADMGPCPNGLTLDRIDPHGNYEPGNCRWATWETQRGNKRCHHAAASTLRS